MLATEKQVAFIMRLAAERKTTVATDGLTKDAASRMITALLATPTPPRMHTMDDGTALTVGMYKTDAGDIFKVQKSQTGNLYAKQLVPIGGRRLTDADTVVQFEFVYAPSAVRTLSSAQRMTLEQARAFGIRYGVCCVCGITLKDAKSVAAGIGPICARRV